MPKYTFRNQYKTFLFEGHFITPEAAWNAFWDECKYPNYARNIDECRKQGIYYDLSE